MKPLTECFLYAFVDTAFLRGRAPAEVARELCDGGADIIQLRAKQSSPLEVRRMAETILPVTEPAGIALVINDHVEVALETGAPYCHLGQEDFFEAGYRHVSELIPIGSRLQIGLSSHAPAQAGRALRAGAACLGVGPVFATTTKPNAAPATLDYVRWAAAHLEVPWFAIGGISLDTLELVLAAGARRVCVVSAILNAPDLAQACREFKWRLSGAARDQ